jgi:transcriptional regulator with XRE-family HTH domain
MSICSAQGGLPRLPNPIDQHFAARICQRRLMLGMSQTELAQALDVSSKQLQKYESGVNQINARLLQQMACALRVPLPYFFDGCGDAAPDSSEPIATSKSIAFIMRSDDVRLIRAFASVRNPEVRKRLLLLIEAVAASPQGRDPRSDEGAA